MEIFIFNLYNPNFPPVPWQRARSNGKIRFNPKNYDDYKKYVSNAIKGDYPAEVRRIQALSKDERRAELKNTYYFLTQRTYISKNTGDDDNYRKTIEDAIQDSELIINDKQIRGALTTTYITKTGPGIGFTLYKFSSYEEFEEYEEALWTAETIATENLWTNSKT